MLRFQLWKVKQGSNHHLLQSCDLEHSLPSMGWVLLGLSNDPPPRQWDMSPVGVVFSFLQRVVCFYFAHSITSCQLHNIQDKQTFKTFKTSSLLIFYFNYFFWIFLLLSSFIFFPFFPFHFQFSLCIFSNSPTGLPVLGGSWGTPGAVLNAKSLKCTHKHVTDI